MTTIVHALNEEWATLARSPKARRALMRWTARHPELGQVQSLNDFVDVRQSQLFEVRSIRHRNVLASNRQDRRIEIIECSALNAVGNEVTDR